MPENLLCGKKLEFGNSEQIIELKRLRNIEEEKAIREEAGLNGELVKYKVNVITMNNHYFYVDAYNENDAWDVADNVIEKRVDIPDICCADDIEIDSIEEVKDVW